jgi:phage tail-like protein
MPRSHLFDPLAAFRFIVEIDGIHVGGFTEASGFQSETKLYSYREGGQNGFVHYFPDSTEHARLILKRGMTFDATLWDWHQDVANGMMERKSIYVFIMDSNAAVNIIWAFTHAFPVKWAGPELNAMRGAIAVESVEFVYQEKIVSSWK